MLNLMKCFDTLQRANFSSEQAKAVVDTIGDAIEKNVVTRVDLILARQGLEYEIKNVEARLTIKLGTMLSIAVAVIASMVKFL